MEALGRGRSPAGGVMLARSRFSGAAEGRDSAAGTFGRREVGLHGVLVEQSGHVLPARLFAQPAAGSLISDRAECACEAKSDALCVCDKVGIPARMPE